MSNRTQLGLLTVASLLLLLCQEAMPSSNDSFVAECANVIALRNTVEEYVRAVKQKLVRGSREYMQVEDDYSRASEMYEEFVKALDTEDKVMTKASDAQRETAQFIERCRSVLKIDHLTDLEEPRYTDFVPAFHNTLTQQRKASRSEWKRTIQGELAWTPWSRIR
jgi:hypothetical protein